LHIGSKPNQTVYQAREGGDTFLVLSLDDRMLYLYQTVETLLCPTIAACAEYGDTPFFWSETTGMMYVLSAVSTCSFEHVENVDDANEVLTSMEAFLSTL
jgi:hypothetical protein